MSPVFRFSWLMLQQEKPEDYVVATGETRTLQEFVAESFSSVGLDWEAHVVTDQSLLRPSEIMVSCANPAKASQLLGWSAHYRMGDVVRTMVAAYV